MNSMPSSIERISRTICSDSEEISTFGSKGTFLLCLTGYPLGR